MPDLPDFQQSVAIDAANVTIPVSGSVSISAGTVTIANASIAVINATGTKITSARPPRRAIFVADSPNPNTQNFVLDADVQAIVIELPQPLAQYVHVKVAWHPVSGGALGWVPLELFQFSQNVYVVPITPDTFDTQGNVTNSLDITIQGTSLNGQAIVGHYLYESAPMWLEFFAPPFAEPNQPPLGAAQVGLAGQSAVWIVTPVVNIQLSLFNLVMTRRFTANAAGAFFYIGQGSTLPVATPTTWLVKAEAGNSTGTTTPYTIPFSGAQLTRGNGLWVWNDDIAANAQSLAETFEYSLG